MSDLNNSYSCRRCVWRISGYFRDRKRTTPIWMWILLICPITIFLSNLFRLSLNSATEAEKPYNLSYTKTTKSYLIKTEGCRIPDMDPSHLRIRHYIFKQEKILCNNGLPPLIDSNQTSIFLLKESALAYDVDDVNFLVCCYRPLWRGLPGKNKESNNVDYKTKCIVFKGSANIQDEFIMVECFYSDNSVYKDYFSFVPAKKAKELPLSDQLNILILGIDGISRLNFHRQLPQTKQILDGIKALEFFGYNKVGDSSFSNMVPILTGLSESELVSNCWKNVDSYFDKCPMVWKKFQSKGVLTAFGEDSFKVGVSNYDKRGVYEQPTDYYWKPFNVEAEDNIGNQERINLQQCIGSRETYEALLGYVDKFTKKMLLTKNNYFGVFWITSLSHNMLNLTNTTDYKIADLINKFQSSGILNNTIAIFLSNNGLKSSATPSIYEGSMEEKLPFLYVYLPYWYKERYSIAYSNLMINTRRLVTPFDIHETLIDFVELYNLPFNSLLDRANNMKPRAQSLLSSISTNRKCKTVGIPESICLCQEGNEIPTNDRTVLRAAHFAVDYINGMLNDTKCSKLALEEVWYAKKHSNTNVQRNNYFEDYTITLRTKPSGALFEATLRKTYLENAYSLSVVENVKRINYYGTHNACVTNDMLKMYCFCTYY